MTRRLGKGDPERGRARLALVTVLLLTVGLLLGVSPGGSLTSVLAAVSGSPTGTTTQTAAATEPGTPTPSAGSPIQLLNPSTYASPVTVSNKSDSDTQYHLVAWVGNLSAVSEPSVEFEIRTTGATPSTVLTLPGTKIGTGDTYETKWQVAEADGNYTVHATLFSGNTQISTDSQAVTVRKSAETVEMSYPTTEGTLGVYNPPGAAPAGFVVDATASETATNVTVFYGTSPPGTEQNWRRCTTQVTVHYSNGKDKRIGCTIADNVQAGSITGVATVAHGRVPFNPGPPPNCSPAEVNPGPPPTCPSIDSGDAHRVLGYEQAPASVSIAPANSSAVINNCHELTATILDNFQRPIWRAPIDVHATGPSDGLQFGRSTRTSAFQPPDQGGHDSNEPTFNCSGTGTPPQQAEHNHPGGVNDDKHIESVPATASAGGTDNSGGFIFALRSSTAGVTGVEAWYDGTEDDANVDEPSGGVTVNWLATTPSPTRSASATATATSSASATATATATRSASPPPASRTITLETSRSKLRFRQRLVLSGLVDSSQSSCESGQSVRIERAAIGGDFQPLTTVTTGSDGSYAFEFVPEESSTYRAVVDASSSCQAASSSERTVLVRVQVKLSASDNKVQKGDRVRLKTSVAPCGNHDTTEVVLLRSVGRAFREIARKGLNRACRATFKTKVKRSSTYKVRWPSQDDNHESGTSREVVVEVRRRR
jgi:hypothetical protein